MGVTVTLKLTALILVCLPVIDGHAFNTPHQRWRHLSWPGTTRIIGGEEASENAAPHMVALVLESNNERRLVCGGSIISERLVMTAAHCIDSAHHWIGLNPALLGVLGSNEWASTHYNIRFSSFVNHPDWNPWLIKSDVGVLVTESRIILSQSVQVVGLQFDWVDGDVDTFVTGWGQIRPIVEDEIVILAPIPAKLQMLHVKTLTPQQCTDGLNAASLIWGYVPPVDSDVEICTYHSPGHGMCMGDSGSGLIGIKSKKQIGVVSWGLACALGAPDIFVRVSGVKQFLKKVLKQFG